MNDMAGRVTAVHRAAAHSFSKQTEPSIELIEGLGVVGDAHFGATVQHRSRVATDPSQPNLRQVHLIHSELFAALASEGYDVSPGQLGENITTTDVDLLGLPVGSRLSMGDAVITVTGLRNPCSQINAFQSGLLKRVVRRDEDGTPVRLAGVMGIVSRSGTVAPGVKVLVALPAGPHLPLTRV
jgi:MOSC domain-containing protein YiiM